MANIWDGVHIQAATPAMARNLGAFEINNQALQLEQSGDLAGAEKLYLKALKMKEEAFGRDSIQAALTLNALGEAQLKMKKLDEAEKNLRRAVAIRNANSILGMDAAVSRENLAQVLEAKGELLQARGMRMVGMPQAVVCGHYDCPRTKYSTLPADQFQWCSQCHCVLYCSKECQKIDWKRRHKHSCKAVNLPV